MSNESVPWHLWEDQIPTLNELIENIDRICYLEIDCDSTGAMKKLYDFFNSGTKPITPREFMQYWNALSDEEQAFFKIFPEHI